MIRPPDDDRLGVAHLGGAYLRIAWPRSLRSVALLAVRLRAGQAGGKRRGCVRRGVVRRDAVGGRRDRDRAGRRRLLARLSRRRRIDRRRLFDRRLLRRRRTDRRRRFDRRLFARFLRRGRIVRRRLFARILARRRIVARGLLRFRWREGGRLAARFGGGGAEKFRSFHLDRPESHGAQDRSELLPRASCQRRHLPVDDESLRGRATFRRALRRNARLFADDRRPDHAAEAFNDVHPDNPLAARPIAGDAIALVRNSVVQWERGPARGGDGGKGAQKLARVALRLKTP